MSGTLPLFDRRKERQSFKEILDQQTARLVTVRDRSGEGKSRLLEEFHSACGWEKIPASLTLVSINEIRSPFDLVNRIIGGFGPKRFTRFRALDKERVDKNFDAFTSGAGHVHIGGSVSGPAAVAGKIGAVVQPGAHVENLHVEGAKVWSDDHERIARDECVAVFYEELYELAQETPVVILLDEFEGFAANEVRDWVVDSLLREHVFDDEQPSKLIVVIAGTTVPDLRDRLKERHDEFVHVISELSRWTRDDIRDFLTEMTGRDPEPVEVDTIEMWFDKKGVSIEVIVNSVKAWPG